MPVDTTTVRPYDAHLDPASPVAPRPGWAKIVIAVSAMLISTLSALLAAQIFPPESATVKLIGVAIIGLGTIAPAVAFIVGESSKERKSIDRAADIKIAKVEAAAEAASSGVAPVETPTAPTPGSSATE